MTSKPEWKPGQVLANENGEPMFVIEVTGNTIAAAKTGRAWVEGPCVVTPDGNGWRPDIFANLRPLVVIDPEDREQVERLRDHCWRGGTVDRWQDALREHANPTPPKPEEPLGLGAVVEAIYDNHFVHVGNGGWQRVEKGDRQGQICTYAEIDVVRVLSPGYTEGGAS